MRGTKSMALMALVACGTSGNDAPADGCAEGACEIACWPSWGDCNQDEADGCETELTTDTDCGACGAACTEPETCVMGGCGEIMAVAQGSLRAAATSERLVWATYWPTGGSAPTSSVHSLDRSSGEIADLTTETDLVEFIAVDETNAYLTQRFTEGGVPGSRLISEPLAGGALETIALSAGWIGLDDTHVYWNNPYDVMRAPKSGGDPEAILTLGSSPHLAGIDASYVYVGLNDNILRVDKEGGGVVEVLHSNLSMLGVDPDRLELQLEPVTGVIYLLGVDESGQRSDRLIAAPTDGSPAFVVDLDTPDLCDDLEACYTDFSGLTVGGGEMYWSAETFAIDALHCELAILARNPAEDPPETRLVASFRGCDYANGRGRVVAVQQDEVYIHLRAHQGALIRKPR